MSTRPAMEIKMRFDGCAFEFTEVSYNSKHLASVGYSLEEFVSEVLKGGIPKMISGACKISRENKGPKFLVDYSLLSFQQFQVITGFQILYMSRNQELQKVNFTLMLYGNYVKGSAELSAFVTVDQIEPIPMTLYTNTSAFIAHYKFQELDSKERKQFLRYYYPEEYLKLNIGFQLSVPTLPNFVTSDYSTKKEQDSINLENIELEAKLETENNINKTNINLTHDSHLNQYNQQLIFKPIAPRIYMNILNKFFYK